MMNTDLKTTTYGRNIEPSKNHLQNIYPENYEGK